MPTAVYVVVPHRRPCRPDTVTRECRCAVAQWHHCTAAVMYRGRQAWCARSLRRLPACMTTNIVGSIGCNLGSLVAISGPQVANITLDIPTASRHPPTSPSRGVQYVDPTIVASRRVCGRAVIIVIRISILILVICHAPPRSFSPEDMQLHQVLATVVPKWHTEIGCYILRTQLNDPRSSRESSRSCRH